MTDIFDLAKAFLSIESMSNKKFQKLCYYAKAWHLALYDENLISEPFEAWIHGPVNPALYDVYKDYGGEIDLTSEIKKSNIKNFDEFYTFVLQVYDSYGHLDENELEIISHEEKPWIEARGSKRPWEACDTVISEETIKYFYRGKQVYASI